TSRIFQVPPAVVMATPAPSARRLAGRAGVDIDALSAGRLPSATQDGDETTAKGPRRMIPVTGVGMANCNGTIGMRKRIGIVGQYGVGNLGDDTVVAILIGKIR